MSPQDLHCRLMAGLLAGSEETAQEVEALYRPCLEKVVRRFLPEHRRRWLDYQDVVQEVWASFFRGKLFKQVQDRPEHLLRFLRWLARLKALVALHYLHAGCRNGDREQPLPDARTAFELGLSQRQAGPEEQVEASDLCQGVVANDDLLRSVLDLRLSSFQVDEIAARLKLSLPTVKRALRRIRERLLAIA